MINTWKVNIHHWHEIVDARFGENIFDIKLDIIFNILVIHKILWSLNCSLVINNYIKKHFNKITYLIISGNQNRLPPLLPNHKTHIGFDWYGILSISKTGMFSFLRKWKTKHSYFPFSINIQSRYWVYFS